MAWSELAEAVLSRMDLIPIMLGESNTLIYVCYIVHDESYAQLLYSSASEAQAT